MVKRKKLLIITLLLLFVLSGIVSLPIIYSVSKRLSKTSRVEANVLLVEGWLPPYAVELAYKEYIKSSYEQVITTGIRISGYYDVSMNGYLVFYTHDISSHAELARNELISLGLDSSLVLAVPGKKVWINRTLSSALAFRDWLEASEIEVKGINIVTIGTHARRTWMTYNKILDKKYKIGIISLPDYREHSSRKYKVLKTLRESLGLVYYWFLLLPY